MRIINIIEIVDGDVESIESFGIFEEQLSDEVVEKAETLFGEKAKENFPEISDDELEACIEDGHFEMADGYTVKIIWSDI
jgi:hypothetical protein